MSARRRPPFAQHFLHDERVARRIAAAVSAPANGRVAEIGPGRGALTEHLLARGWRVIAIEIDRAMIEHLTARFAGHSHLVIVERDFLEYELSADGEAWHVVGNLPYAVTSPIVFRCLDQMASAPIAEMVFMVQREVADRMIAEPGTRATGAMTVGVQLSVDVELVFPVGAGAFRPPPRVQSAVVRLTPHDRWGLDDARRQRIRVLAARLFQQRRKQIQKTLRTTTGLGVDDRAVAALSRASGLDLGRRPESLTLVEWLALEQAVRARFPHFPLARSDSA